MSDADVPEFVPRYTLVRPCGHCPFRSDRPSFIREARAREIVTLILTDDHAPFWCHETLDYTPDGNINLTPRTQHCAGALALLEAEGRPNVGMRVARLLGLYDPDRLDPNAPTFASKEDFITHHTKEIKQ